MAPCTACNKRVINRSKALQCYVCDEWTHIDCWDVAASLYDQLVPYHGHNILPICNNCKLKLDALRRATVDPHGSSSSESSFVDDPDATCVLKGGEITSVKIDPVSDPPVTSTPKKRKRSQKQRQRSHKNSVSAKLHDDVNLPLQLSEAAPKSATDATMVPGRDALLKNQTNKPDLPTPTKPSSREQCVIVLNLPESSSTVSQQRLNADLQELRTCFTKLFVAGEEEVAAAIRVKSAFRLGKRLVDDAGVSNSRPLKVVLNTAEEAQALLRRAYRLRGTPVRILRDLSPEDRLRMKEALSELRERRANGETDLFIRDFRVIKRKPKVRWTPLTIDLRPMIAVENTSPPSQSD